jgi:hypothetical protein
MTDESIDLAADKLRYAFLAANKTKGQVLAKIDEWRGQIDAAWPIADAATQYPEKFRTTLFCEYMGIDKATWEFFARNIADPQRHALMEAIRARGGNCIFYLTNNLDGDNKISIFEDCNFGGNYDVQYKGQMRAWVTDIRAQKGWLFPTLYCDNSKDLACIRNPAGRARYYAGIKEVHEGLEPLYVFSIEMNELIQDMAEANALITEAKVLLGRPVGVHCAGDYFPEAADFIIWEASGDPHYGGTKSVARIVAEANWLVSATRKPAFFQEFIVDVNSKQCELFRAALELVPGLKGIG